MRRGAGVVKRRWRWNDLVESFAKTHVQQYQVPVVVGNRTRYRLVLGISHVVGEHWGVHSFYIQVRGLFVWWVSDALERSRRALRKLVYSSTMYRLIFQVLE